MTELSKKDLMEAIQYGHAWHVERIKTELEGIIASSANMHSALKWDDDEKLYYMHDSECNLFVEDGLISTRSDKDNVPSTDITVEFPITNLDDIRTAYQRFIALTLEGED